MERLFGSEEFSGGREIAVALGNFDGVHLGHRYIIDRLIKTARRLDVASAIYTFDPHPVRTLSPCDCPPLIQTLDQRLSSLEDAGVEICIVEPFTFDFAHISARDFLERIIASRLKARAAIIGYDFTFGLHREGAAEMFEAFAKGRGMDFEVVHPQFIGETLISSTNIRRMVAGGEIKSAEKLLGRPYSISGHVVSGRGLGGALGARTANIDTRNELIPKDGVYITTTSIRDGRIGKDLPVSHPSVTSIGNNPTFHGLGFSIETHLIDFSSDVLGKSIEITFHERIRDQIAFASEDLLAARIKTDIDEARRYHAGRK
jgi:riboflavin kinase/FMN adenylyltransferase